MTTEESHYSELAAQHAERCADRLRENHVQMGGEAALRMFASSLRAGGHLRPAQSEAEGAARAALIVEDVLRRST
jgi:hypothetical protein